VEIITGEARRRWSQEEKLAAVAATFQPETTVASVARRIGANTGMLFSWRKQFRAELGFPEKPKTAGFAQVMLTAPDERCADHSRGVIEVAFPSGVRLKACGDVAPALAAAILSALASQR
jgi:transposase-like protein